MNASLTALFDAADTHDPADLERLFSHLYQELHRLARRELGRTPGMCSVGPTTLLHQAYINMSEREGLDFVDRARFMGYASRVMRGLIIDHMRRRYALRRGGQFEITTLNEDVEVDAAELEELTRVSDSLDELAAVEPQLVQVVDLRFFCGFTFPEIAAMHGVSERTIQRQWRKARLFLHQSLGAEVVG